MHMTKEKQFFDELDEALEVFGVSKTLRQCEIIPNEEYKVDAYIIDYMLVVQYDSGSNKDCDYKVDEQRQKEIEEYFNVCGDTLEITFIRLSDEDSNTKNIAKVLKAMQNITPLKERLIDRLDVLDKVGTLMGLEGVNSLHYYSHLVGVSEFELYKSIKEEFGEVDQKSIEAKQVKQVMMFIDSPVAREWRNQVLRSSMTML